MNKLLEKMGAGSDPGAAGRLCRDSTLSLKQLHTGGQNGKLPRSSTAKGNAYFTRLSVRALISVYFPLQSTRQLGSSWRRFFKVTAPRSASVSDEPGDIEVRSPVLPCKHQGSHLCARPAELPAALREKGAHLHLSFLEHFDIPLFSALLQHDINLFVRAVCPGEGWSQTAFKARAQSLHPTENPISQGPGENFHPSSASHSCSAPCGVIATPLPRASVQPCN